MSNKENKIIVSDKLIGPHPLIIKTRKCLLGAKNDKFNLVMPKAKKSFFVHVSKKSITRAMCILDALVKEIENKKYKIIFDEKHEKVFIKMHGEYLTVILEERAKRTKLTPGLQNTTAYEYSPTGELSLIIDVFTQKKMRKTWSDGKIQRIEDSLNNFLSGLIRVAKQVREEKSAEQSWPHNHLLVQYNDSDDLIKTEEESFNELCENAQNWHKSQEIRSYVKEVYRQNNLSDDLTITDKKKIKEWMQWAHKKADHLDPFKNKPFLILELIQKNIEK